MYPVLCSRAKAERNQTRWSRLGRSRKDEKRTGPELVPTFSSFSLRSWRLNNCANTGRRHRSSSIEKSRRFDIVEKKGEWDQYIYESLVLAELGNSVGESLGWSSVMRNIRQRQNARTLYSRDKNVNFYQLYKNKFFTTPLFEKLLSSVREFYPREWNFRSTVMQSIVFTEPFHKTWYLLQRLFYSYPHVTHQYKYIINIFENVRARVTNI